jgi:glycosyltransferase involved in cell wall biosynthesis
VTSISAYVPCFNNAATVGQALRSLQAQRAPVAELFLADDGSSDSSLVIARLLEVPVVALERNMGRGAVRATAMHLAQHELVLSCDATNQLPADFLQRALPWFDDPQVAAVYGRICQHQATSLADRWRGRHLFRVQEAMAVRHGALLSTYGCVLRREAVLRVGNFDRCLRHSEDADLGRRLLAAGFDVVFDPTLLVVSGVSNSLSQVLERYWRWYAGPGEAVSVRGYLRQVWYSLKVMTRRDLQDGDLLSLPISLFAPHYQFWRSWARCRSARVQN